MKLLKYILVLITASGTGLYSMDKHTKPNTNTRKNRKHMLLKQMHENYEYLLLARKLTRSAQLNINNAITKIQTNLKESIKLNIEPLEIISYNKRILSLAAISIEIDYPDYLREYNEQHPDYLKKLDKHKKDELWLKIQTAKKFRNQK